MKFINLTPHQISVHAENGELVETIPPSGMVARVNVQGDLITHSECGTLDYKKVPFPIKSTRYGIPYLEKDGAPIPFPKIKSDTGYIVSSLYLGVHSREDFFSPGPLIRDSEGNPVGCTGLTQRFSTA